MTKISNKAFSLVEIATVVVIISLLITAIAGARPMLELFKYRTAQNLTKSSPVLAIGADGSLKLWLESSLDDSIIKDSSNVVSKWIDRSGSNNHATQATAEKRPIHIDNALNSVPALKFDDDVTNPDSFALPDGTIPPGNQDYTFFFVTNIGASIDTVSAYIHAGTGASNKSYNSVRHYNSGGNEGLFQNWWFASDFGTATGVLKINTTNLTSFRYESTAANPKRRLYINGQDQNITGGSADDNDRNSIITNNYIGRNENGGYRINGYIAEIIIYNRALPDDEREAIEKYLAKKYSIKIAN